MFHPRSLKLAAPAGSRAGIAALALLLATRFLPAMGTEEFGSKPVSAQPGWAPGVADAVNLATRVYSRWINGNESFFFSGGTRELNEAIEKFAAIRSDGLELVILPRPGGTSTFQGKAVDCDWEVHAPSGIYLGMAGKEEETRVFRKHPALIVYAGSRRLVLADIRPPRGPGIIGSGEVLRRLRDGMKSADDTVAGQAAYLLGELAGLSIDAQPLVDCLKHKSDYVRACAAGALAREGRQAQAALTQLRDCLNQAKEEGKKAFQDAIEAIEKAPDEGAAIQARRKLAEEIEGRIRGWRGAGK